MLKFPTAPCALPAGLFVGQWTSFSKHRYAPFPLSFPRTVPLDASCFVVLLDGYGDGEGHFVFFNELSVCCTRGLGHGLEAP